MLLYLVFTTLFLIVLSKFLRLKRLCLPREVICLSSARYINATGMF